VRLFFVKKHIWVVVLSAFAVNSGFSSKKVLKPTGPAEQQAGTIHSIKPGAKKGHHIIHYVDGSKSYFKEMPPCRCLVPQFTSQLAQLVGLDAVVGSRCSLLKGKPGLQMDFLQGYKPIRFGSGELMQNISLQSMTNLDLVRFLSGALDARYGNFMFNPLTRDVKAIDNDGPIRYQAVYGDWGFINFKDEETVFAKINFERDQPRKLMRKQFLQEVRGHINASTFEKVAHFVSKKYSSRNTESVVFLIKNKNIWIQRRRVGLVYPHIRYIDKKAFDRLVTIEREQAREYLSNVECEEKELFISLFAERQQHLRDKVTERQFYQFDRSHEY
jgi:hypothetical protein